MGIVGERALAIMRELKKATWDATSRDTGLTQEFKTFMYFHLNYPWLPGFLGIAITPLAKNLGNFLGRSLFQLDALTFYWPSAAWWSAHAETSHPPAGVGCDAAAHVDFLTVHGSNSEFGYAIVMKDGAVHIAESRDFVDECSFWFVGKI